VAAIPPCVARLSQMDMPLELPPALTASATTRPEKPDPTVRIPVRVRLRNAGRGESASYSLR